MNKIIEDSISKLKSKNFTDPTLDIRVLLNQCSNVKKENSCYCIKHYNASLRMNNKWWLGLITDERPESPIHPISGKHNWSKDKDGNDYIKELKKEEKKEGGEGKIKIKRPRGRPKGSKNKVKNLNLI